MATAQLDTVLRHLRQMAGSPGLTEQSDGQLLRRFALQHDHAAFAALVQRHGRLVWGVCRHVLGHHRRWNPRR